MNIASILFGLSIATMLFLLLFILPRERFPRWLFGILCAWWWPKPETPATLLAVAVDCMTDDMINRGWEIVARRHSGGDWEMQSALLKASIGDYRTDGFVSFHFKGTSITPSRWDDYVLAKVSKRVIMVKFRTRKNSELRDVAETMLAAAHVIKEDIKQLEARARAAALPSPPDPMVEEHKRRVDALIDKRTAGTTTTTYTSIEGAW